MSPEENNSVASGGVPGINPLDLTGSTTPATNLSMADSLASAEDNLTSAGMAAQLKPSDTIGLDQIGASDPVATMAPQSEPLVPASPVPGSIGSVTSVPPVASPAIDPTMDFGMNGGSNSALAGQPDGAMDTGAMASTTAGFGMPTANNAFGTEPTVPQTTASFVGTANGTMLPNSAVDPANNAQTFGTGTETTDSNMSAATPAVNVPYNPFAPNPGVSNTASPFPDLSGQKSSSSIPPALQPPVEKTSAGLGVKGEKKMVPMLVAVLMGVLIVALLASTIIFAIMWQNAEKASVSNTDNGGNSGTVTNPITPPGQVAGDTLTIMSCTKSDGAENAEVFGELQSLDRNVMANFKNGELTSIDLTGVYTMPSNEAAEGLRPFFESQAATFEALAGGYGVAPLVSSFEIVNNTITQNVSATSENLTGEFVPVFGMSLDEAGGVDKTLDGVTANLQNAGFVCVQE